MSIFFCSNDTFLCEMQFRVCSRGLGAKVPPTGAPRGLGDRPPRPGPGLDPRRDRLRETSCICRGPLRGYCWPSRSLKELLESSKRFPWAKGSMDYRPFSTNQRSHWMRQPLLRCPCVQGNRDVLLTLSPPNQRPNSKYGTALTVFVWSALINVFHHYPVSQHPGQGKVGGWLIPEASVLWFWSRWSLELAEDISLWVARADTIIVWGRA